MARQTRLRGTSDKYRLAAVSDFLPVCAILNLGLGIRQLSDIYTCSSPSHEMDKIARLMNWWMDRPQRQTQVQAQDLAVNIEGLSGGDVKHSLMGDSQGDHLETPKTIYETTEDMRASVTAMLEQPDASRTAFRTFSQAYDDMQFQFSNQGTSDTSEEATEAARLRCLYVHLFAFSEMDYFEKRSLNYAKEFLKRSEEYARACPDHRVLQFTAVAHYVMAKTYGGLDRPKEGVEHAQQALDLYVADDLRLLDMRQSIYDPSTSIPSDKVEVGQLWLGTPGIGCIVSCHDLLATLYLKSHQYQDAWKQHDTLVAMSGPDHQAQENWRQSRNGTPVSAFCRAWRIASKLFSAKNDFIGARASLELVIAQMAQQDKFDIIGEEQEFLFCADRLDQLILEIFREDAEHEEDIAILDKHFRDGVIIKRYIRTTNQEEDATKMPEMVVPPFPQFAHQLSLESPSALRAILESRRSKIAWWW